MDAKIVGNATICFIVFGSIAFFFQKLHNAPDIVSFLKPPVEQSSAVTQLAENLVLEDYDVKFGQAGNKVDASFSVRNDSDIEVKNISIFCTFHDSSGKQWGDSRWAFFKTIPPGESQQVSVADKRYISHKALSHKSRCEIVDLVAGPAGEAMQATKSGKNDSEDGNH